MEVAPSRLPSHDPNPEAFMRCFLPPTETRFYAGIDLHARSLFLGILDRDGQERLARNSPPPRPPSLKPSGPSATASSSAANAYTAGASQPSRGRLILAR